DRQQLLLIEVLERVEHGLDRLGGAAVGERRGCDAQAQLGVTQLLAHVAARGPGRASLDLSRGAAAAVGIMSRAAVRVWAASPHAIVVPTIAVSLEPELARELDRVLELLEIAMLGDPCPRG